MTAPNYCVLEGDPTNGIAPRRPDALCEDMGGLQFQDDPNEPPRANEHMSAKDFKQVEMLVQRLTKMAPALRVDVSIGMSPTVSNVLSVNSTLTTSNVTISRIGAGHYRITWPSGSLPATRCAPRACGLYFGLVATAEGVPGTPNAVDLYAVDAIGGALTDTGYASIDISGE